MDRLPQGVGKFGMNLRTVPANGSTIRKNDSRHVVVINRTEPKEPVDPAKPSRVFAAGEFAIGVPERKESVAANPAPIHIDELALFSEH